MQPQYSFWMWLFQRNKKKKIQTGIFVSNCPQKCLNNKLTGCWFAIRSWYPWFCKSLLFFFLHSVWFLYETIVCREHSMHNEYFRFNSIDIITCKSGKSIRNIETQSTFCLIWNWWLSLSIELFEIQIYWLHLI